MYPVVAAGRIRRAPAVLGGLCLVLTVFTAPAAAADAAPPPVPTQPDQTVHLTDVPLLNSHLMVANGRAYVVTPSKLGVLADEFGYTPEFDASRYVTSQPLPMGDPAGADLSQPGPLPMDARYLQVIGHGSNSYLAVAGQIGGSTWRLAVAGPLADGMPVVWHTDFSRAPVGLAAFSAGPGDASIAVGFADGFELFAPDGSAAGGTLSGYHPAGSPGVPLPGWTLETMAHRPVWDNPSEVDDRTFHDTDAATTQFVAVLRSSSTDGPDILIPAVIQETFDEDGALDGIEQAAQPGLEALVVDDDSSAVVAYDWAPVTDRNFHQSPRYNTDLSGIQLAMAVVPAGGGAVVTHWWRPNDKVASTVQDPLHGPHIAFQTRSAGLADGTGSCGTAAAGEVPALDINASTVTMDITDVEDYGFPVADVACAVRTPGSSITTSMQTWVHDAPLPGTSATWDAGSSTSGALDVVQVHGCVEINQINKAYDQDGNADTPMPFTAADGSTISSGGVSEDTNCSMGPNRPFPNVAHDSPEGGTYPGSLTSLTTFASAGDARLRAWSIQSTADHGEATVPEPTFSYANGNRGPATLTAAPATSGGALIAALPDLTADITVRLTSDGDTATPGYQATLVQRNPQPVALLMAPPTVAGSEQNQDAPQFALSHTVGSGTSDISSTTGSITVGASVAPPIGNGAEIELTTTWEKSEENEDSVDTSVTVGEQFNGSSDDNVLVYNDTLAWHWDGTIIDNSLGMGIGTPMDVERPYRTLMTSATLSDLAADLPDLFGPAGVWAHAFDDATPTVGDPGSYLHYDGSDTGALDAYCDGSVAGELIPSPVTGQNVFVPSADPIGPDVLLSDMHHVQTGSNNSEGATFTLDKTETSSRTTTQSITASVTAKAGYGGAGAVGGVSYGHGWGESSSTTVGNSTEYSATVGMIPYDIPGETYQWNMFECRRTLQPGLQVLVLGFSTDGYHGSGGLTPMGDVVAIQPSNFNVTSSRTPDLDWQQDTGLVKRYRWQLQATDADSPDNRSGYYPNQDGYASTAEAEGRPTRITVGSVTGDQPTLLPDMVYRWRVTARDFLGRTSTSDWAYFRTPAEPSAPGRPTANFDSPLTVPAGSSVQFTDTSDLNGEPDSAAEYAWDFDDGSTSDLRDPSHPFAVPGLYAVAHTVTTPSGTDQVLHTVRVDPAASDDAYQYHPDQALVVDAADGVLANDHSGSRPTLAVTTPPQAGTVQLDQDGGFSYTPATRSCLDESFVYTATIPYQDRTKSVSATVHLDGACPALPSAPRALAADAGDSLVSLSWEPPDTTGGGSIAYNVYRSETAGSAASGSKLTADPVTLPAFEDTTAANDTTYYYAVTAVNAAGAGPASAETPATPRWACPPQPFEDVTVSNTFCGDIRWLLNGDITRGYLGGDFGPTVPVSRQAMAAFLYRLSNPGQGDPTCDTDPPFPDVPTSNEFCGAISWLRDQQITQGFATPGFHPTEPVSRQAMAAFLYRLANPGQGDPTCDADPPFPDVPTSNEFCGAISWLRDQHIAVGYSGGDFDPMAMVSRQAMAGFLHRLDTSGL